MNVYFSHDPTASIGFACVLVFQINGTFFWLKFNMLKQQISQPCSKTLKH